MPGLLEFAAAGALAGGGKALERSSANAVKEKRARALADLQASRATTLESVRQTGRRDLLSEKEFRADARAAAKAESDEAAAALASENKIEAARVLAEGRRAVARIGAAGKRPPANQVKIDQLRARGFSQNDAEDIASNRVRLTKPDQFGNVSLVNVATGERKLVGERKGPGADVPGDDAETGDITSIDTDLAQRTLADAARGGTGPWSNLKAAVDAVVGGALDIESMFPDNADNRTYLRTVNQIAKTALVNNPKFPVAEQKIVQDLLPSPDDFWTNPQTEANNVDILSTVLKTMVTQNTKSIQSGNVTQKRAGELANKNDEIGRILMLISPTGGTSGGSVGGPPQRAIDFLKSDPSLAEQFDAKYGAGASSRALGR